MELHHLTATSARELLTRRELSPVELLEAVLLRIEKVEPQVNALTEQLVDEARAAALESEGRFAEGSAVRPLEGIPLVLKEEHAIAGRTLEEGSLLTRGEVSDVTHPVVERVLAAGAVVHARSTTPEFSCTAVTHSRLWGVTRNPWNLDVSPGGSSGGAGAALAAGETLLATGSDIGGSIRIPSSFCGVVGFKPPFGRVPGLPPFNLDTFCADGPMGRSVADVALLQNVLAGRHPGDAASLPAPPPLTASPAGAERMRVALCLTLGDYVVDPAVEASTRAAADALRAAGVHVEEVSLLWTRELVATAAWSHFGAIMGPFVEHVLGGDADGAMPYTRDFARRAAAGEPVARGLIAESVLYEPLGVLLEQFDALLCPTLGVTGFAADAEQADLEALMTLPFNAIGRVPVLAVPSGLAPNGVPTGVQLVGRTYDDQTVFTLGAALEASLGLTTGDGWWPV